MNVDEKLKDILKWLDKHGLKDEANDLESLIKNSESLERKISIAPPAEAPRSVEDK
jgi:hypothetical protein